MYEVKDKKLILKQGSIKEGLIAVASGKGGVGNHCYCKSGPSPGRKGKESVLMQIYMASVCLILGLQGQVWQR